MWPFKKKLNQIIWTDRQIELYERQVAAREALGQRYICHPVNDVRAKNTFDVVWCPPPKLRRVK